MTEILWNGISINGAVPTGYGQTFIRNIQVDPDLQKGDIPSLELSLDADAFAKEEDYWAKLRNDLWIQQNYRPMWSLTPSAKRSIWRSASIG